MDITYSGNRISLKSIERIRKMIRKIEEKDVNKVADIWLDTNLKAHYFIDADYWKGNFEFVKKAFVQSEIYVYENAGEINGFIGLDNEYIAGIFVAYGSQSKGIGKQLIDYVKEKKQKLILNVYQKNIKAIDFYTKEGFVVHGNDIDKATGEKELEMIWIK